MTDLPDDADEAADPSPDPRDSLTPDAPLGGARASSRQRQPGPGYAAHRRDARSPLERAPAERPPMDGFVSIAVGTQGLRRLWAAARDADATLAAMLVAVFGVALDRHARVRDMEIALLHDDVPCVRTSGHGAGSAASDRSCSPHAAVPHSELMSGASASKLARCSSMARGSSRQRDVRDHRVGGAARGVEPGAAFRYARRSVCCAGASMDGRPGRSGDERFAIVMDVHEFENGLWVEVLFRLPRTAGIATDLIAREIVHELVRVGGFVQAKS